MGIYLNPGNENYKRTLTSGTYVDKTMMIAAISRFIDVGNNYICISRPRRFGKTIAGNMLAAYYSKGCDSRELFSGLKIAGTPEFGDKLNCCNVIQLDMNSEYQNVEKKDDLLKVLIKKIKREMVKQFPNVEFEEEDSLADYMLKKEYGSYWGMTSTYETISERIRMNFAGTRDDVVRMLAGESVDVNVTRFMNTMNSFKTKSDVFTYLIHLGYLAYDRGGQTCRIPNKEVRREWLNAIEEEPGYEVTNQIIRSSKELLAHTLQGDGRAVAKALDVSHIHVTSNRSYNNEDALQSAIYLAYIYALNKYTLIKEMTTGKGFADVVFIPFVPDIPAMIIELKRNGSTESALQQIREKKYFDSLAHYSGRLLFVGINYDEKEKTHACEIEEFDLAGNP